MKEGYPGIPISPFICKSVSRLLPLHSLVVIISGWFTFTSSVSNGTCDIKAFGSLLVSSIRETARIKRINMEKENTKIFLFDTTYHLPQTLNILLSIIIVSFRGCNPQPDRSELFTKFFGVLAPRPGHVSVLLGLHQLLLQENHGMWRGRFDYRTVPWKRNSFTDSRGDPRKGVETNIHFCQNICSVVSIKYFWSWTKIMKTSMNNRCET